MHKTSFFRVALAGLMLGGSAFAQTETSQATTTTTTTTTTTGSITNPPVSDPAPLSTHEGWNSTWAMLFSLNNILVQPNILTQPLNGQLGASLFLTHRTAVRGGLSFGHTSNPATVTKVVTTAGDSTVATYQVTNPGGFTDQYNVTARADYLFRLLDSPIAPYVGGGLQVAWTWSRQSYTDDKSVVDQRTRLDNHNATVGVAARAVAGAEWRLHPSFALFAEYNVNLTFWQNSRISNTTLLENTVGGVTSTSRTVITQDVTQILNLSAGVAQGATLGLEVFF